MIGLILKIAAFGPWQLGLELRVLNGALTFGGLWLVSRPAPVAAAAMR